LDKAARAAELDSGNPDAAQLRDQLRQQIQSRETALPAPRASRTAQTMTEPWQS
jgi:hypothetical protein